MLNKTRAKQLVPGTVRYLPTYGSHRWPEKRFGSTIVSLLYQYVGMLCCQVLQDHPLLLPAVDRLPLPPLPQRLRAPQGPGHGRAQVGNCFLHKSGSAGVILPE